jgi:hypothetical protein
VDPLIAASLLFPAIVASLLFLYTKVRRMKMNSVDVKDLWSLEWEDDNGRHGFRYGSPSMVKRWANHLEGAGFSVVVHEHRNDQDD